jgi:hypothetical protein
LKIELGYIVGGRAFVWTSIYIQMKGTGLVCCWKQFTLFKPHELYAWRCVFQQMAKNYAVIMDFGTYHGLRKNNGLRIFRVTCANGLPRLRAHTHTHTHTHQTITSLNSRLSLRYLWRNITVRGENPDFLTIFIPFYSLEYFWHTFNHSCHRRKIGLFTYHSVLTRPVFRNSNWCTGHSVSPVRRTKITGCIDWCSLVHWIVVYIEIFILSIL